MRCVQHGLSVVIHMALISLPIKVSINGVLNMNPSLLEAIKGKTVKEGTYTFLIEMMDELLKEGKSTTLFTGREYIRTSPVRKWIFMDGGAGLIVTDNSVYHVIFRSSLVTA